MRSIGLIAALMLSIGVAHADNNTQGQQPPEKHGTAKGAAVGALAGHEIGSGHAVAGAATGAAIGHHDQKKANEGK